MALKFGVIRQTVFLEASPEVVYNVFLDAKKHSEFTGSPSTSTAELGVEFNAWDGYISAKNLELVKNKKIVQEWETTEWPDGYPRSRLELTMTSRKGGTELRMVHSRVPAEQVASYTEGWMSSYWDPLAKYLANQKELAEGKPSKKGSRQARG